MGNILYNVCLTMFKMFTASFIWKTCQDTHEVFKMFELKKPHNTIWVLSMAHGWNFVPPVPPRPFLQDGSVRKISGTEEALGLRLKLQGVGTVPWAGSAGWFLWVVLSEGLKKGMLESLIIDYGPWVDQILCSVKVYVRYIGHQLINVRLVSFGWGGSR